MKRLSLTSLALAFATIAPRPAAAQPAPTPTPTASTEVVVTATKLPEDPVDVPGAVEVVTGDEIRRTNARTLADAIQDVAGVDIGTGSDNGGHAPNVGLWGLKEFDALLFTVDGVPIGGPFNPSLTQIPLEDVERIEIVKGPQGTLYGVSAFTGMINVVTRRSEPNRVDASLAAGSFSEKRATLALSVRPAPDLSLRLAGSFERSHGWQDRTHSSSDRLNVSLEKTFGAAKLGVSLFTYLDTYDWGTPLPVDAGEVVPGFLIDKNYAVVGARQDHRVYGFSSSLSIPLSSGLRFENTLGATRDEQISVRSFVNGVDGDAATAEGVAIRPKENVLFDDARLVAEFSALGGHKLVGGAALTYGKTTADGIGFDIDLTTGEHPVVPRLEDTPVGDDRSFRDRRTFVGFYVNDEWTPIPRLTLTAGARFDSTSEALRVQMQERGTPEPDVTEDERSDRKWSGGVSALVRILDKPAGPLDVVNAYVSLKSAFKPAAPNLSEAENARILNPERTRSGEIGIKTRLFDRQLSFDATFFQMNFENVVVAVQGPDGGPELTNAGEERFRGMELDATWRAPMLEGLSVSAGYAHHDARFVHFSFFTPDGDLRVVDGNQLELVPRDLWNLRAAYAPKLGPGGFVAVRHQNRRPLNRRNTFFTGAFYEWDAGASWECAWGRVSLVGRNLGDSRHYTSESEIGDSQFYVAPPRRFSAEVAFKF